jgi:hypothetical protein
MAYYVSQGHSGVSPVETPVGGEKEPSSPRNLLISPNIYGTLLTTMAEEQKNISSKCKGFPSSDTKKF